PASDPRDRDLPPPPRGRSRSRSPVRESSYRRSPPPSKRPPHAPIQAPNPSNVLGVFGLSIRTVERDLDEEFSRFGHVEKVVIVYDQRQSDRSRGFGFITMSTVEEATRCIKELNGVELNGRRIRVDYSVTDRPHAPTPGEYMGHRR
ncbi:RNA-binding domain-containing protein, partial [Trametopsis cervina]